MDVKRLKTHKTILVTGGLGFIGSHFIDKCLSAGHKIINFDKQTYAANANLTFSGDYKYVKVDIADIDDIPHCDMIVNFAAESHVDNSIDGNDVFMHSNVMGVHRLLEVMKMRKISNMNHSWGWKPPLFVQISTDEVFGDIMEGSFHENDRHLPSNPYSASKSCAEQLVVSWSRTYDLPYLITRTTNNYGPRQHPEKLIPRTITNLLEGRKAIVHGSGSYVRNWIHVLDNVNALYTIIDSGELNESYHISTTEEYSVTQIVTKICLNMGLKYSDVVDSSTDRSGADHRYALDCSKTTALGWTPQHTLDESLVEIIEHYRERMKKNDSAF